jgi:hypothetical protein
LKGSKQAAKKRTRHTVKKTGLAKGARRDRCEIDVPAFPEEIHEDGILMVEG